MANVIICYYHCGRCGNYFERWHDKPLFSGVFTSFTARCPKCQTSGTPYQKSRPSDDDYPLPSD